MHPETLDGETSPQIELSGSRSGSCSPHRKAYLLVFEGDTSRMLQLPVDGTLTIGRGENVDLYLLDNRVSRNHATIEIANGECRVTDRESHNGTLVNGLRLSGSQILANGDVVTIGSVTLVFHTGGRPRSARSMLRRAELSVRAEEELERARRYQRPLALLAVAFENEANRARISSRVLDELRRIDIIGWSAPDEIMVIMPETDRASADLVAGRLLTSLLRVAPDVRIGLASSPTNGSEVDTLLAAVRTAVRSADPQEVAAADNPYSELNIGGSSAIVADAAMVRLYELIQRLATSDLPVLVHGETGTGKELAASAIHHWSSRTGGPLIAVNCAALPENLVESELFGHAKGAFSGAVAHRSGMLESASGGTIFLDEIGELPLTVQAKLLRVLETKKVARIGEVKERDIDIRIVAATNRDLAEEVMQGGFRQDLFYRLSGATVWIPPLRDRPLEIPILAEAFLKSAIERAGREPMKIRDEAMQVLATYGWPGNVRELKNVMDYVVAAHRGSLVLREHVEERMQRPPGSADLVEIDSRGKDSSGNVPVTEAPTFRNIEEEIRELEKRRMLAALEATGWNKTRAAELIGMPIRTFTTKFKQYELQKGRAG